MPELHECIAHFLCMLHFFQYCIEMGINLSLIGLWADATNAESHLLAPDGLVYQLSASSTVKRGSCSAQTSLWPEMWKITDAQPEPPSIQFLVWKGVHWTSRAIIMDMGELCFQVCILCMIGSLYDALTCISLLAGLSNTHFCPIYPQKCVGGLDHQDSLEGTAILHWTCNGISRLHYCISVPWPGISGKLSFLITVAQYKIYIAQLHWANHIKDLPPAPSDVYDNYFKFLNEVAEWIAECTRSSSKCQDLPVRPYKSMEIRCEEAWVCILCASCLWIVVSC